MKWLIIFVLVLILILLSLWVALERSLVPRKTTLKLFRDKNLTPKQKLENYIYSVRPDLYLKPASWPVFTKLSGQRETGETYHGKVLTREDAGKLITLNRPLDIPDLDQIIPFAIAKSLILQEPFPNIAVLNCPCRAQKKDACLPRDVCMAIGEPFVSFVMEHHPHDARRLSVEEALKIISEEEERGHIHTAWFKECMHNRFYVICNCCSCCCLGMASFFRGVPRVIHSGYRPVIQEELCLGCGTCADICPFKAVAADGETAQVDPNMCMGCGICTTHCPSAAISLDLAPDKGIPLDVDVLASI